MKKIRALIVDDESLARDRMRQLLQSEAEIDIIGECSDGRTALATIQEQSPDLVFLDVQCRSWMASPLPKQLVPRRGR